MPTYGPRDAASVLMGRGHRVALRFIAREGAAGWRWQIVLDGQAISLRELEDQAEKYEKLRNRQTQRARHLAPVARLRSVSVVTDLLWLPGPVTVVNQGF